VSRTTIECDGLAAFLSPGPRQALPERDSSESGTLEFTGTRSYGEAVRIMREGWPEAAEQARALSAQLNSETADSMTCERPSPVWDVAGDDADVARYLEGEPENMVAWMPDPVPAAGRVVRLLLGGRVAFHVTAEMMRTAAVMLAAAADALEARGVRVEIVVAYAVSWGTTMLEIRHRLKAAEEPLDLPRVVAGMHPSAFRRVAFRWMETVADLPAGYGCGGTITTAEGDVVLNIEKLSAIKPEGRVAWLRQQAEAVLGIPA
jgi:hypothetical protein